MVIGAVCSIDDIKKFAMINKDFDTESKFSNVFPIFLTSSLNSKVQ